MGKRRLLVLDTNVLINHLRRLPHAQRNAPTARKWARQLIETYNTNWIASPVRIEFLAGARNTSELSVSLAYLEPFALVDGGQIVRQDWQEAERIAKRVVKAGRARKLGDCLLKAISLRLNCDVVTADTDFERRVRP